MSSAIKVFLLVLAATTLAGCATPGDGATWKCSADSLADYSYNGSDYAMIRLQAYSSGDNYKVSKNAQGTEAAGKTGDGTPFKCMKLQ